MESNVTNSIAEAKKKFKERQEQLKAEEEAKKVVGSPLILVVDDDAFQVKMIGEILKSLGYKTEMETDGHTGLANYKKRI
jgi:PleD family two-component response regulator